MKSQILAAGLSAVAILVAAAPAPAQDILTQVGHLTLEPGQSIQRVINRRAAHLALGRAPDAAPGRHAASASTSLPALTSGTVLSATLVVGDAASVPVIQFAYNAGPAGLADVGFTFTSPNGQNSLNIDYFGADTSHKGSITLDGQVNAPYFAEPGKWTLTGATIADGNFNSVNYTAAQAAALIRNPVITVLNGGPVDITPPVITAGKVLTPTVSLSAPLPQFRASLSGTDNLSGVAFGYVIIQAPGNSYGQTETSYAPVAFLNGTLEAAAPIFGGSSAGTWSITGFVLCDVAFNCTANTQTPAQVQALFGTTTFKVTN